MKRDMDLFRKIMLAAEESDGQPDLHPLLAEGYSEEQLSYHSYQIIESRLAKGIADGGGLDGDVTGAIFHLTPAGHDFIEAIRNDTIWAKTKAAAKASAAGMVIDTLKSAAAFIANQAMMAVVTGKLPNP